MKLSYTSIKLDISTSDGVPLRYLMNSQSCSKKSEQLLLQTKARYLETEKHPLQFNFIAKIAMPIAIACNTPYEKCTFNKLEKEQQ